MVPIGLAGYSTAVHQKPLNVGRVAKILGLSKKTVLNYITKDKLPAFQTMGGHYRIWPGDVNALIEELKMDVPFQFQEIRGVRVLLLSNEDRNDTQILRSILSSVTAEPRIEHENDTFEACIRFGSMNPHAVVIRFSIPNETVWVRLAKLFARHKIPVFVLANAISSEARHALELAHIKVLGDNNLDMLDLGLTALFKK